jgi:predicted alpha/beta superfamily hydrolase
MTATEGFKRRKPVESAQPDSVVVSIGYPLADSVYSPQRMIDFRPPFPEVQDPPPGADAFIAFIDEILRPFIHSTVFPNVDFTREALYGHSGGGLFIIYALITRPDLFDTFLSASPAISLNNGSILDEVHPLESTNSTNRPAFSISYGSLEQFPVRRRTETEEVVQRRKAFIETFRMTDNCNELYRRIKNSSKLRDVVLNEYIGQDHASVGDSALTDGIDYFVDW